MTKDEYEANLKKNKPLVAGWENCPSHCHQYPGLWDSDNKEKSGTICEECRRWNSYEILLKEIADLKANKDRN